MSPQPSREPDAAELLRRLRDETAEDPESGKELWNLVYGELHRLAEDRLRRGARVPALQPTALVHEAWLRMSGAEEGDSVGRAPFLAFASRVMRKALVDHARSQQRIALTDLAAGDVSDGDEVDLLQLDAALTQLASVDPDLCQVVELRFFGGLNHPEIAEVMETPMLSVELLSRRAGAWIRAELKG